MAAKSGMDILEEILTEILTLRKELKILDQKIAHIANSAKIADLANRALGTDFHEFTVSKPKIMPANKPAKPKVLAAAVPETPTKGTRFNFERSDASKTDQIQPNRAGRNTSTTLVSGKMITVINKQNVSLSGLIVKIFDNKDNLIKETKTNRAGTWLSHLQPGQYVVNIEGQYKGQDLVPVNMHFEVKPGMKNLEVK